MEPWDVIIVGAGPIGLAAAIMTGKKGLRTLVLEKNKEAGYTPRGETIRYHPLLKEILGDGAILENGQGTLSVTKTWDSLIHSPWCKKEYLHTEKPGVNTFEWKEFIHAILSQTKRIPDISIIYLTEVIKPLISDTNICIGVQTDTECYYAHTVLDASGWQSNIGRYFGIDYNQIMYPIIKSNITNFQHEINGFEAFFCPQGAFKSYPSFPPGMIFIFPHLNGEAEIGMMIFSEFSQHPERLTEEYILDVWHDVTKNYCRLKELLAPTHTEYEAVTNICSQNMVSNPILCPGLILIGGAAGFLDASKAAGFLTGMESAKFWGEVCQNMNEKEWTQADSKVILQEFKQTKVFKYVSKMYRKIRFSKFLAYRVLKSPKALNTFWRIIKNGKKRLG